MSFNPGTLLNPYAQSGDGAGPPAPQPAGAVSPEHALPADVMQAPDYAATETDIAKAIEAAITQDARPAPAPAAPGAGTIGLPWAAPAPAAPAPAADPGTAQPGQAPNWDDPNNPYRAEAMRARNSGPGSLPSLQADLNNIPTFAAQAHAQLVSAGMSAEEATQQVTLASRAAAGELRAQIAELSTQPAAIAMTANHIAQRFSVPGVTIDPRHLMTESTPQAMEARARTIVQFSRTQAAQTRVTQGTDRVEAPATVSTGAGIAQRETSSFEDIRAGLRTAGRR